MSISFSKSDRKEVKEEEDEETEEEEEEAARSVPVMKSTQQRAPLSTSNIKS